MHWLATHSFIPDLLHLLCARPRRLRWVVVAHPLLMRCRATRAHGRPAPRTSSVRFLFSATHGYVVAYEIKSAPAALLPHLPPPPPLTLLWARANYCSSIRRVTPFSLPTLHPTPKISPKTPGLTTSRPPIANRPRCAPFLPPPHPPPLILLRASFDYCSSIGRLAPFSPPTLHPTPQIAPKTPGLATSRPLTHLVFASYRNVADSTAPGTVVHASLTL